MRKFPLRLDDLVVVTFETLPESSLRGTVLGLARDDDAANEDEDRYSPENIPSVCVSCGLDDCRDVAPDDARDREEPKAGEQGDG